MRTADEAGRDLGQQLGQGSLPPDFCSDDVCRSSAGACGATVPSAATDETATKLPRVATSIIAETPANEGRHDKQVYRTLALKLGSFCGDVSCQAFA